MTHYKRGLEGNVSSGRGRLGPDGRSTGMAAKKMKRIEKLDWPYWISHRGGPFLIHNVVDCDPLARGCNNSFENLIEQGFFPCPKCKGGSS